MTVIDAKGCVFLERLISPCIKNHKWKIKVHAIANIKTLLFAWFIHWLRHRSFLQVQTFITHLNQKGNLKDESPSNIVILSVSNLQLIYFDLDKIKYHVLNSHIQIHLRPSKHSSYSNSSFISKNQILLYPRGKTHHHFLSKSNPYYP